jgi:hydrogenase expression/formation protein HypD
VVKMQGNPTSLAVTSKVYEPVAAKWRGIGEIPASGLKMREAYRAYDIEEVLPLPAGQLPAPKKTGCRCGEVLKGIVTPHDCPLFGKACVPTHAIGPCMVSVEGVCAAWYKYGKGIFSYGNQ